MNNNPKAELLYKDDVYSIVGAAMAVYNELGPGFLEPVYQEALGIEFLSRQISNHPQQELQISYKGHYLKKFYVADFVVDHKIIIEIKAMDRLTTREDAQVINYLKATGMQLGLLINFGSDKNLEWKRIILSTNFSNHSRKLAEISG
jgi:GxxExxY protein